MHLRASLRVQALCTQLVAGADNAGADNAGAGNAGADNADADNAGPLEGVTVVDMTSVMAGPLTGAKLADMGATVVKIENITGDSYRGAGTKATLPSGERLGSSFAVCNRGKRSINVNSKTEVGELTYLPIVHLFS
jgi:hypothetical protein